MKEKKKVCKHKNLIWEQCFRCGYETAWCEKCDAEVGKEINDKQAEILS